MVLYFRAADIKYKKKNARHNFFGLMASNPAQ